MYLFLLPDKFHKGRDQFVLFTDVSQLLPTVPAHSRNSINIWWMMASRREPRMVVMWFASPYSDHLEGKHMSEGKHLHFSQLLWAIFKINQQRTHKVNCQSPGEHPTTLHKENSVTFIPFWLKALRNQISQWNIGCSCLTRWQITCLKIVNDKILQKNLISILIA